jgi:predicted DNA binding CopG/RHH family protein
MKTKPVVMPVFNNESEEADWWASAEGRSFVKQKSAELASQGKKLQGSALVSKLNKTASVQIALRLPESDLAEARKIATRKGIGYQTLLKMLLHEGLQREANSNTTN